MLSDTVFEVLLRKKVPFAYYLWQLPGHKATISEPGESVRLRVPIGRPRRPAECHGTVIFGLSGQETLDF